jgi:hypothetical protein
MKGTDGGSLNAHMLFLMRLANRGLDLAAAARVVSIG